jgi:hypothetical protein
MSKFISIEKIPEWLKKSIFYQNINLKYLIKKNVIDI